MRRWFKLWMRQRTQRIPAPYSRKVKERLAVAYCFFAWNATALALYVVMKESYPMTEKEKKEPAFYYARLWQKGDVKVINMEGLTVTGTFNIKEKPKLQPEPEEFLQESILTDKTPELLN